MIEDVNIGEDGKTETYVGIDLLGLVSLLRLPTNILALGLSEIISQTKLLNFHIRSMMFHNMMHDGR